MLGVYSTCTFKSILREPLFLEVYVSSDMGIHDRLKAARIAKKLTQEDVGAHFASAEKPEGFGKQTISSWENGRNEVTASQLTALCKLYGVSADYLLFGKKAELSAKESELLDEYRATDPSGRMVIEGALNISRSLRGAGNDFKSSPAIAKQ